MEFLKQTNIIEANKLLNYFDISYVNGSYKRVSAGMNIKLRKTTLLFLSKTWNVLKSLSRTNNIGANSQN